MYLRARYFYDKSQITVAPKKGSKCVSSDISRVFLSIPVHISSVYLSGSSPTMVGVPRTKCFRIDLLKIPRLT